MLSSVVMIGIMLQQAWKCMSVHVAVHKIGMMPYISLCNTEPI